MKALFRFAFAEEWAEKNPFDNLIYKQPAASRRLHEEEAATYQRYSADELNKIFALKLFSGSIDDGYGFNKPGPQIIRRHRYWAPVIALWSGLRMNEILQLEKADVGRTNSGIAFFSVSDADNGGFNGSGTRKRVKNRNSIRNVPISPVLIEMGFLDWVDEQKDKRLFPEATIGGASRLSVNFSKKFATMAEVAGVWESRRKVFHSFRNNFTDAMRQAGVPLELREAINRWDSQKSMDQNYGSGHTVDVLFREISRVTYPGLDMSVFRKPSAPQNQKAHDAS